MAKVDTDKFIALLIGTYCRRMCIDRTSVATILDDVLEQMGFKVDNGEIVELTRKEESNLPDFERVLSNVRSVAQ